MRWTRGIETDLLRFKFDGVIDQKVVDCADLKTLREKKKYQNGVIVLFDDASPPVLQDCGYWSKPTKTPAGLAPEDPVFPNGGDLTRVFVVINTAIIFDLAPKNGYKVDAVLANVLTHEAGHAVGLEHSWINFPPSGLDRPLMSPQWSDRIELHEDDQAGVSDLYPKAPAFGKKYGWLRGTVISARSRLRLPNVNIIATEVRTGQKYSFVTRTKDVLGDRVPEGTFMLAVPVGNYCLRLEKVPPSEETALGQDAIDSKRPQFLAFDFVGPQGVQPLPVQASRFTEVGTIPVSLQ